MRRRALAALVLAVVCAPAGVRADEVTGSILLATGTPVSDGNARPERCVYQADPQTGQGVFGWVITTLTPQAAFTLTAGSLVTDVDIVFLRRLTPCDQDPDYALPEHDNGTGDESGIVPASATVAIVTMRNGPPGAAFTYSEE